MSSTFVRVGHLPTPDPRESQASRDLAAMAPIMNRVHEGAVRMQAGGEVVNSGPARYQHSEASLAETGSVMASVPFRVESPSWILGPDFFDPAPHRWKWGRMSYRQPRWLRSKPLAFTGRRPHGALQELRR
jgi:hypothetical protein